MEGKEIMPYYEFACTKCGEVREEFYRVIPRIVPTSVDITCNRCECIQKHSKILSTPNFHLKGSGWADDGYTYNPNKVVELDEPS